MRITQGIRFIMNNKGVSLVETIIAAAILSIMIMPVMAGFSQSYRNYNASYDYYMASVDVSNIMMEISSALSVGDDVSDLLLVSDYSVSGFQYVVHIAKIINDDIDWILHSNDVFASPEMVMEEEGFADFKEGYILVVDICRTEGTLVQRVVQPVWV